MYRLCKVDGRKKVGSLLHARVASSLVVTQATRTAAGLDESLPTANHKPMKLHQQHQDYVCHSHVYLPILLVLDFSMAELAPDLSTASSTP